MPPFASSTHQPGFSGSLLKTLRDSRAKIDAFCEQSMEQADAAFADHQGRVAQEQTLVDTQVSTLLELELERGLGNDKKNEAGLAKRRQELAQKQQTVEEEIDELRIKEKEREDELKALQAEEAKHRGRADETSDLKKRAQEAKQTTVDDLTRGVVNYKFLGLDFEKADGDRLKFTFTHLDAGDPSRTFSFVLNVNEEDTYDVEETSPPLSPVDMETLLENLNDNPDDLSAFCRGMRNAFSATL